MSLTLTTPPATEPVALADLKNYVRIDSDLTSDDALLTGFIKAAREHAEMLTGRSFITQKWRLRLDGFSQDPDCPYGGGGCNVIQLERGVVQSVDAISYLDTQGATQTFDLTLLASDLDALPARISPKFGQIWPIPVPQIGAVWIDYTAGYSSSAAALPAVIAQWIYARASTINTHRELIEIVTRGKLGELPYVDSMLDSITVTTL